MAKKKNRLFLWILLVVLVVLITLAYFKGQSKPKGAGVEVEESQIGTINETVSASGKIFPAMEVKISSDVSGEIVELYVNEGDSISAGQILAKIDPDTYISMVERGKASVNSAKAQLAISKAQVESNRAQKDQITAQLENAKSVHKRNEKLSADGVISDIEFEQSLSSLRSLEANLRASEASIKSALQNSNAASFSIESAKASLKELTTNLSRTTIKAPMGGIISSLPVEQGERVVGTMQFAGTEMMRISNLNNMEVHVDVSENDIPSVSVGDFVEIEVDAYVDKKFRGNVTEISSSASNMTANMSLNTDQVTNFMVKMQINPDSYADIVQGGNTYPFRPGMSASVDIFTKESTGVVMVPIQSVTVREKDDFKDKKGKLKEDNFEEVVFVLEGDTVNKVKVITGIQDDEYIEILSGINAGSLIVTGPYSEVSKKLQQGVEVHVNDKDDED